VIEDAYTDADLFETIRQIRGDELDGAGSLHLFHGEATFDEQALGCSTRHKLKQLPTSWDLWLASEWKQLDAHQQQSFFGALSQLKRIHALRTVSGEGDSAFTACATTP
jgi:hypothetical protein